MTPKEPPIRRIRLKAGKSRGPKTGKTGVRVHNMGVRFTFSAVDCEPDPIPALEAPKEDTTIVPIKVRFSPNSEDALPTIEWLQRCGLCQVETWQQVYDIGVIEIQLRETPEVVSYLAQIEDALSISRVTSEGVVFYLTDIPLWAGVPEGRRRVSAERSDGNLFIPMSNVVCINTFGSVYAHQPAP